MKARTKRDIIAIASAAAFAALLIRVGLRDWEFAAVFFVAFAWVEISCLVARAEERAWMDARETERIDREYRSRLFDQEAP